MPGRCSVEKLAPGGEQERAKLLSVSEGRGSGEGPERAALKPVLAEGQGTLQRRGRGTLSYGKVGDSCAPRLPRLSRPVSWLAIRWPIHVGQCHDITHEKFR